MPTLVRVTTPMIRPTQAQETPKETVFRPLITRALNICLKLMRVDFLMGASSTVRIKPIRAAREMVY